VHQSHSRVANSHLVFMEHEGTLEPTTDLNPESGPSSTHLPNLLQTQNTRTVGISLLQQFVLLTNSAGNHILSLRFYLISKN